MSLLMTKPELLDRYEKTLEGIFCIDVTTGRAEDLYNNFDRSLPYTRRDLDQDLVDYLIDSARELRREPFIIRFSFEELPGDVLQARIRRSVNNYYLYLVELEKLNIRKMMRRSLILMAIGIAILFLSIQVNTKPMFTESVVGKIFSEGLIVAAWVSLWESLATFLVEWAPLRKNIRRFRILAEADIVFRAGMGQKSPC
jgi:hypothetical protein